MSTGSPVFQPTARPGNTGIAYTEFLYVSLALIMLIILICLVICGMKRVCHGGVRSGFNFLHPVVVAAFILPKQLLPLLPLSLLPLSYLFRLIVYIYRSHCI